MTFKQLVTPINTSDADVQRRGRTSIIIGMGMMLLSIGIIPLAWIQGAPLAAIGIQGAAGIFFLGAAALAHYGQVSLASTLIFAASAVLNLTLIAIDPSTPSLPFFLALVILIGTVLLPPTYIWMALITCLLGNALAISLFAPEQRTGEIWSEALTNSSVLMVAVATVGYLSASGIKSALIQVEAARKQAEEAGKALAANNSVLEQRVEERTAALRQIADEYRATAEELKASLTAQHELNRIVAELAVPVIPVRAGTLVVPLVGNIDSDRAQHLLTTVLSKIEQTHAHTVVLDATGVALIDTQVAAVLMRVVQATRLMGTETALAGIRPEVAQTLVGLGVDLHDLHTAATLQEAIEQRFVSGW